MQFHVDLVEPFHYSAVYLIIVGSLLALVFIALLLVFFWRPRKKVLPTAPIPTLPPLDLPALKQKYLLELSQLSAETSHLSSRAGHQKLSLLMRRFVFEATGIDMTKKTLAEIDQQKFPSLHQLIREFYSPEFAAEGTGDLPTAISRVAEEIKAWK